MKNKSIIFFVICCSIWATTCFSQTHRTFHSNDTTIHSNGNKYVIKIQGTAFPQIRAKFNGIWKSYHITENAAGRFEYSINQTKLNGINSDVLVLYWSNALYGSGGGTTRKGFQIWKLDLKNTKKIVNEIVYCSDESFGRHGGNAFHTFCQKRIQIKNRNLIVYHKICKTNDKKMGEINDVDQNCDLTAIKPGTYTFKNGKLKRK